MAYDRATVRFVWILLGLVAAGALAALLLVRQSGPQGQLRVEWEPATSLAPGVSVREGKLSSAPAWRVIDVAVDPSKAQLRISGLGKPSTVDALVVPGAVAAINGGYFDARFQPTGWLVDRGAELAPRQSRAQGGVLGLQRSALYIGPSAGLPFKPEFALQNSPRLVEPGGVVGIRSDDGKRASRTLACDIDGRLHLVVIAAALPDGPTLLEAATLLAASPAVGGLGCSSALNLDGGPSTGIWLPPASGIASIPNTAPIAYAISVLPR